MSPMSRNLANDLIKKLQSNLLPSADVLRKWNWEYDNLDFYEEPVGKLHEEFYRKDEEPRRWDFGPRNPFIPKEQINNPVTFDGVKSKIDNYDDWLRSYSVWQNNLHLSP